MSNDNMAVWVYFILYYYWIIHYMIWYACVLAMNITILYRLWRVAQAQRRGNPLRETVTRLLTASTQVLTMAIFNRSEQRLFSELPELMARGDYNAVFANEISTILIAIIVGLYATVHTAAVIKDLLTVNKQKKVKVNLKNPFHPPAADA